MELVIKKSRFAVLFSMALLVPLCGMGQKKDRAKIVASFIRDSQDSTISPGTIVEKYIWFNNERPATKERKKEAGDAVLYVRTCKECQLGLNLADMKVFLLPSSIYKGINFGNFERATIYVATDGKKDRYIRMEGDKVRNFLLLSGGDNPSFLGH